MSNDGTPVKFGESKPLGVGFKDPRWAEQQEPSHAKGDAVPNVLPQPPQQVPFKITK